MGTFNDFSQLKKFKPVEPAKPTPVPPPSAEERALANAADSSDYFSSLLGPTERATPKKAPASRGVPALKTTVVTPATVSRVREEQAAAREDALKARIDALTDELNTQKGALEIVASDLNTANEQLDEAHSALAQAEAAAAQTAEAHANEIAALRQDAASLRQEIETLKAERAALQQKLAQPPEALAALQQDCDRLRNELARAQSLQAAPVSTVLIDKPAELAEKFKGEIREHVVEALTAAYQAAEAAGRDRRARILEAVLATNPPTGELESRREEVKQIVKEAGSKLDDTAIAALEKLGFRYVSGNKHHKLEWAGIRFPLSKTPSDSRACLNSAAEICNRTF